MVSGTTYSEHHCLRQVAATITGYPGYPHRGVGATLYLATQRDPWLDPAFGATTSPVFTCHRIDWEQLVG